MNLFTLILPRKHAGEPNAAAIASGKESITAWASGQVTEDPIVVDNSRYFIDGTEVTQVFYNR